MSGTGFAFSQDYMQEFGSTITSDESQANMTNSPESLDSSILSRSNTSFSQASQAPHNRGGYFPSNFATSTQRMQPQSPAGMLGPQQQGAPAGMLGPVRKYAPPVWGRSGSADRIDPNNLDKNLLYQVKKMETDARALPYHLSTINASIDNVKKAVMKGMMEVADYIRAQIPSQDNLIEMLSALTQKMDTLLNGALGVAVRSGHLLNLNRLWIFTINY